MNFKELIQIKELYTNCPQSAIKANIKRLMKDRSVKHAELSELLKISSHTAYSYTNAANNNKPELYNLLILSDYLNVSILDILNIN